LNLLNWSDPNTWLDASQPALGDKARIEVDVDITLDVSPPALAALSILGSLQFADVNLELTAYSIVITGGELRIGTLLTLHTSNATISINGPLNVHHDFGGRYIVLRDTHGIQVTEKITFDSRSHCYVPANSGR